MTCKTLSAAETAALDDKVSDDFVAAIHRMEDAGLCSICVVTRMFEMAVVATRAMGCPDLVIGKILAAQLGKMDGVIGALVLAVEEIEAKPETDVPFGAAAKKPDA